jgi:hypothetical protein
MLFSSAHGELFAAMSPGTAVFLTDVLCAFMPCHSRPDGHRLGTDHGENQETSKTYVNEKKTPASTNIQPVICRAHHSILESMLYVLPTDLAL